MLAIAVALSGLGGPRVIRTPRPRAAPVVPPTSISVARMDLSTTVIFAARRRFCSASVSSLCLGRRAGGSCGITRRVLVQTGDYVQAASEFRKSPTILDLRRTRRWRSESGRRDLRLGRRPELDPSYGETALAIYQSWRAVFPDSDAAGRARIHVGRLQKPVCRETYKTGIFYLRPQSVRLGDHLFQGRDRQLSHRAAGARPRYCGGG